jgi:hypothetical protein
MITYGTYLYPLVQSRRSARLSTISELSLVVFAVDLYDVQMLIGQDSARIFL